MAKVEIVIEGGPYPEEFPLGMYDLEILPRKGESVFYDIGDSVVFEVRDVWHCVKPNAPMQIRIVPIDEKDFEEVGMKTGFFLSYQKRLEEIRNTAKNT